MQHKISAFRRDLSLLDTAWFWGSIIYPFPLVNATSQSAIDSMAFWSSPSRTDPFGLHLKLGYSKKCWAYLSSDLGHIHLLQGNHSGALRVLRAMVDNASPTVGEKLAVSSCRYHRPGGLLDSLSLIHAGCRLWRHYRLGFVT